MTDIISNIKIQKPVPISNRRVSLQQNASNDHPATNNSHQIKSTPLLSHHNSLPANSYALASAEPLSLSYKPTKQHELLLKSSLKLHKNIPTMAKSVRFNMPLVQILHFHVPSTNEEEVYDEVFEGVDEEDEDDGNYFGDDQDDQDEEEENELEDAFLELFSKRLSPCSDYDPNLYHPAIQQSILDASLDTTSLDLKLPNWPTASPLNRSITQMVTLESLGWENARSIIKGRVLVRNVAFEKTVTVRMSFNHWQTWIDVDARYEASSEDAAFDRFVFELVTPNHLSYMNLINSDSHCSLAVKYQVDGAEYWDNNSGKDFLMQWAPPCGYSAFLGAKQNNETAYSFPTTTTAMATIALTMANTKATTMCTTTIGTPAIVKTTIGTPAIVKTTIGTPTMYTPTIGTPTIGTPTIGTTAINKTTIGKNTIGKTTIGKTTIGKTTIGTTTTTTFTPMPTVVGGSQIASLLLLEQQRKIPTPAMLLYQEDPIMQFRKEEYYPTTIISDGYPACNNMYIDPSPVDRYGKQGLSDGAFGVSPQQQQMSAHFQYYLDRKKQDNEQVREYHYPRLLSVTDHDEGPMRVSLTPSSPLLIPPNRNDLVIT
ncbi:putative phosphatase regulatory subunit-domain-containing protein [Mucor mucedo]|uniref:putative phosphatase regulatory subunit-domain-containing protein n=1 Tax=Mucor mucedo TaxID=29922 RepID=UPI002220CA1F|nr:putative phosphatase regulatory subunit-domain-containing protein [Mucor mucedo]KAI7893149.1 putative phosphatase regulatory subunit-domain-containing protein [Mucor mucedo]